MPAPPGCEAERRNGFAACRRAPTKPMLSLQGKACRPTGKAHRLSAACREGECIARAAAKATSLTKLSDPVAQPPCWDEPRRKPRPARPEGQLSKTCYTFGSLQGPKDTRGNTATRCSTFDRENISL